MLYHNYDIFNGNSINENIKKKKYLGLEKGFPFIATKDVDYESHVIDYDNGVKIPFNEKQFKIAHKNSVLICAEGGSAGKKIAFNEQDICFGNKLLAIEAKDLIRPTFIYYWCLSPMFFSAFKYQMSGIIGGISIGNFKKLQIPLPPLSVQEEIVAKLNVKMASVDEAKTKTEQALAGTRELWASTLETQFIMKDGLEEKTLKEVCIDFGRGKSKHRPRNDKKLYGGKYPFIQTGDIRNAQHFITEYTQTYNDIGLAQSKLWPKGTICITIAANIAETGILGFDSCFPDSVIGMVVNPKITTSHYVEYLLQFYKARIQAKGKGSAQANINLATFENEYFPFANLTEQSRIVTYLDTVRAETDRLTELYEQKLRDLNELKSSVLQEAFAQDI